MKPEPEQLFKIKATEQLVLWKVDPKLSILKKKVY